MKFLLQPLRMALVALFALCAAPVAYAQVNINLTPPSWGPAVASGQQYYYIPETNGFYDVPARQYVVRRDGRWVRTGSLSGYNTANFHPVIVDYVGAEPWSRYDEYRTRYPRRSNPSNGGLPPGQAKKLYRRGNDNGPRDERRYERRDDGHEGHNDDRRRYEHRDDHGKGKGKDKGKGKGKN